MMDYFYLIPIAFGIGLTALAAFMWSLKSGQYDDLDGAAERILHEETDAPIRKTPLVDLDAPVAEEKPTHKRMLREPVATDPR